MHPFGETLKESGCYYWQIDPATHKLVQVATLSCVPIIIGDVIFWAFTFAGVVALFLIIIGGIKFITSGGDPKQAEGAQKTITWALIGLVVILLSFAIVTFIAKTTGVGCLSAKSLGITKCVPD